MATADGPRPIESVAGGERVWAYNLIASEWQLRRVLRTYSRPCEGNAATVTVAGETIDSTSRHPYFVVRGEGLEGRPRLEHLARVPDGATTPGRWVDAGDLQAGDELLLRGGRIGRIERVRLYSFLGRVYNFEVEDLHCYAVGRSGVLVHNNNGPEGGNAPNNASKRYSGRYADGEKAYRTNVPRDAKNTPVPDPAATGPHTRLQPDAVNPGRPYSGTEFDANGVPVKRVDFSGRKGDPLPHLHPYDPNTKTFGPKEPLQ